MMEMRPMAYIKCTRDIFTIFSLNFVVRQKIDDVKAPTISIVFVVILAFATALLKY